MTEPRFTFGLWTVGNPGRDPFGEPTRPPRDPVQTVERLAEIGAWGVSLHDDDLIPYGTGAAERERIIERFEEALADTGLGRRDGDHQPVHASGVQGRRVHVGRPPGSSGGDRQGDDARSTSALGSVPRCTCSGAGARGPRSAPPRIPVTRWSAIARRSTCSQRLLAEPGIRAAVRDRAQAERAARRSVAADRRARAALHHDARRTPRWSASTPRSAHETMAGLSFHQGVGQALWAGQAVPHRSQRAADRPL